MSFFACEDVVNRACDVSGVAAVVESGVGRAGMQDGDLAELVVVSLRGHEGVAEGWVFVGCDVVGPL